MQSPAIVNSGENGTGHAVSYHYASLDVIEIEFPEVHGQRRVGKNGFDAGETWLSVKRRSNESVRFAFDGASTQSRDRKMRGHRSFILENSFRR